MNVIVAITLLAAILALAMTRIHRRHRANLIDQAPSAVSVLLSVLPDGTALVTLATNGDASLAAIAELVDEAVQQAFALASVDNVEVNRSDGVLLDRLRRPEAVAQVQSGGRESLRPTPRGANDVR